MITALRDAKVANVTGKVTKAGIQTGETKEGKKYARWNMSVPTTDYDLKNLEYNLGLKDAHLKTNGENPKYPLIFVSCTAWEKDAENVSKILQAGDRVRVQGLLQDHEYNGDHSAQISVSSWDKDYANATGDATTGTAVVDDDLPF